MANALYALRAHFPLVTSARCAHLSRKVGVVWVSSVVWLYFELLSLLLQGRSVPTPARVHTLIARHQRLLEQLTVEPVRLNIHCCEIAFGASWLYAISSVIDAITAL
jgi:hypothetical protein